MSRDTGKRSVWVNRVFTHLQAGQDVESSSPIQNEKDRRLQSLHNELKVLNSLCVCHVTLFMGNKCSYSNSFMFFMSIQNQLVTDHILRLLVKWQEGGLSLSVSEHNQYLDELSKQLSSQLRGIIDEIIEEDKNKVQY